MITLRRRYFKLSDIIFQIEGFNDEPYITIHEGINKLKIPKNKIDELIHFLNQSKEEISLFDK